MEVYSKHLQGLVLNPIPLCEHSCSDITLIGFSWKYILCVPMDLTLKCKSWAGSVRHQFGSIRRDVDDLMSKDSMSFIENQVQSVPQDTITVAEHQVQSVGKRFYSDVVQDVHPPSKCDDQGTDVMHLDMETVDLSPDMKHDETSIILNGNSVHAAFSGKRNFRYYKKLIQDALTSQKRLSKEYEHLSILYGDIESESSYHIVPSSTNTSVQAVKTESYHEMSENEWELV